MEQMCLLEVVDWFLYPGFCFPSSCRKFAHQKLVLWKSVFTDWSWIYAFVKSIWPWHCMPALVGNAHHSSLDSRIMTFSSFAKSSSLLMKPAWSELSNSRISGMSCPSQTSASRRASRSRPSLWMLRTPDRNMSKAPASNPIRKMGQKCWGLPGQLVIHLHGPSRKIWGYAQYWLSNAQHCTGTVETSSLLGLHIDESASQSDGQPTSAATLVLTSLDEAAHCCILAC